MCRAEAWAVPAAVFSSCSRHSSIGGCFRSPFTVGDADKTQSDCRGVSVAQPSPGALLPAEAEGTQSPGDRVRRGQAVREPC